MRTRIAFLVAALTAPLLASGCKSGLPTDQSDHWTIDSVPSRMAQHFTGYRRDRHGSFIDYQYSKKKDIDATLRKHFLNNSPDNPFEPDDPSRYGRRPPHSLLPDPFYYIHAEGIVMGFVTLGVTGVFIPIPVDSLTATIFGGKESWNEFAEGVGDTFTGDEAEAQTPPGNSKFRVKNR